MTTSAPTEHVGVVVRECYEPSDLSVWWGSGGGSILFLESEDLASARSSLDSSACVIRPAMLLVTDVPAPYTPMVDHQFQHQNDRQSDVRVQESSKSLDFLVLSEDHGTRLNPLLYH